MESNKHLIEDKGHGKVFVNKTKTFVPVDHQKRAMKKLDEVNKHDSFSEIISIPTGGGKTFVSAYWLLKNAVNEGKKILWIAHRKILLDQALNTFKNHAIKKELTNREDFSFCIVSGDAKNHSRLNDLKIDDDILIISKESLGYGIEKNEKFAKWISSTDPLYMVIDEAHHATARGYQSILKYIKSRVRNLKLIGLTATPFRTNEKENSLLREIFNNKLLFKVDLSDLIKNKFLATPEFKYIPSGFSWNEKISSADLKRISFNDSLPENIMNGMIDNYPRNNRIVQTYIKDYKKYGQTIVFALNVTHAIQLSNTFNDAFKKEGLDLKADYVVTKTDSNLQSSSNSNEENANKIEDFRQEKIQVLVNVQILTEGVDLPKTKTVFLTRPTISRTLMTQMIGRALRGGQSGTESAYIVSFIDEGNLSLINWQTPECIYDGDFKYEKGEKIKTASKNKDINYIGIEKIEEFSQLLNDSLDNSEYESLPFIERIPVGKYVFSYLEPLVDDKGTPSGEDNSVDYVIMVYNSSKAIFEKLIGDLEKIFNELGIERGVYLNLDAITSIEKRCRGYFPMDIIPSYNEIDIIHLIKYFNYNDADLILFSFDQMTDIANDVSKLASAYNNVNCLDADKNIEIYWRDPLFFFSSTKKKKQDYDKTFLLHSFFGNLENLRTAVRKEAIRQMSLDNSSAQPNKVMHELLEFQEAPIAKLNETKEGKKFWLTLQNLVYKENINKYGKCTCEECLKDKGPFNIDHIRPVNLGGIINTTDNLQILCSSCNSRKGDKPLKIYNNFYFQPKDIAYYLYKYENIGNTGYEDIVSILYSKHSDLVIKPYRKRKNDFLAEVKSNIEALRENVSDMNIYDIFGNTFSSFFLFKKSVLDLITDSSSEWTDILFSKLDEEFFNDRKKARTYLEAAIKFYNLACYSRTYKVQKFESFEKCDSDRVYVQFY